MLADIAELLLYFYHPLTPNSTFNGVISINQSALEQGKLLFNFTLSKSSGPLLSTKHLQRASPTGGGMQPVSLQDETTGGTKKEELHQEERWAGHPGVVEQRKGE